MAVVFISPKKRQRMFFLGITIMFLLFLAVVAFAVFLSRPPEVAPELVFNKPKVNVDFSVFDSGQFKNLESFEEMKTNFSYVAITEEGKVIDGFISAISIEEAQKILEGLNLSVSRLREVDIGRDNPFTPYEQALSEIQTEF
jgi:Na+(H+)/acetate symporter ActP